MTGKRRVRLSYANVVASLALFAALGGSSYAAIKLPAGSVGAKQLRTGAVSSAKVKDGSLGRRDLGPGVLAAQPGPAGPAGPAGQRGEQGEPGLPGSPGRSALAPLHSGETIRGLVGHDDDAGAGGADFGETQTFPIPAPQPVSSPDVVIDGGDDDGANRCTGTADAPSAPAGVVCIYPVATFNVSGFQGLSAVSGAGSRFGFQIRWTAPNADDTLVEASWAYTAP
jgi:hypothetical protein